MGVFLFLSFAAVLYMAIWVVSMTMAFILTGILDLIDKKWKRCS